MAGNKIFLDVVIDDNGTTRRVAVDANRLAEAMGRAAKGSAEADRNIKGAAQASSNATKNFSKMSQGMGGLVAAYATVAAQVFALSAAYQFLLKAADFRILIEGQKALTQQTGIGYVSITKSIQAATSAQLGYKQAAQAAAIGTAAGLSATMLKDIASYSQTISAVLGRDLEDTFNRLIRGITKAEPELLDELGIVLRLSDATSEYARTIGKTASELTAYERTQGVALFTLKQVEQKYGALRNSSELSANGIRQLGAAFSELADKILPVVSSLAETLANSIQNNVAAAISTFGLLIGGVVKQALPDMEDIVKRSDAALEKYSNKIADYTIKADAFARGQLTITKRVQPAVDSLKTLASSIQRIQTLQGQTVSPFVTDTLNMSLGQSFNPQEVTNMAEKVDAELAKRENKGYRGKRRDRAFVGISDEALREYKSKLLIMVNEAKRASQGISGKFIGMGNTFGVVSNRMKLRWAQTMSFLQTSTAVAVGVINRLLNTLGYIGLFITLLQVSKGAYEYIKKTFLSAKKETPLESQIQGIGKQASLTKTQLQELFQAGEGLARIKTVGTFQDILAFEAGMSGNIIDNVLKIADVTALLSAKLQLLSKDLKRATADSLQLGGEYTGASVFDGLIRLLKGGGGYVRDKESRKAVIIVEDINEAIDSSLKMATIQRNNILLILEQYAAATPSLIQYVNEVRNLREEQDYTRISSSKAIKEIVNVAYRQQQAGAAIKSYASAYETLNKVVTDSISISPLEQRAVLISNLLKDFRDAYSNAIDKAGSNINLLVEEYTQLFAVLQKVNKAAKIKFEIERATQDISYIERQIKLLTTTINDPIELTAQLNSEKLDLELKKIQEKRLNLQIDSQLQAILSRTEPKLAELLKKDQEALSNLSVGQRNTDLFKQAFKEVSVDFIKEYQKENDSLISRLAVIFSKGTVPRTRAEEETASNSAEAAQVRAIKDSIVRATQEADPYTRRIAELQSEIAIQQQDYTNELFRLRGVLKSFENGVATFKKDLRIPGVEERLIPGQDYNVRTQRLTEEGLKNAIRIVKELRDVETKNYVIPRRQEIADAQDLINGIFTGVSTLLADLSPDLNKLIDRPSASSVAGENLDPQLRTKEQQAKIAREEQDALLRQEERQAIIFGLIENQFNLTALQVAQVVKLNEYEKQRSENIFNLNTLNASLATQLAEQEQATTVLLDNEEELRRITRETNIANIRALETARNSVNLSEKEIALIDQKIQAAQQTLALDTERLDINEKYLKALGDQKRAALNLKLLEKEYNYIKNIYDIQEERLNLKNPYIQEELKSLLQIQKVETEIKRLNEEISQTIDQQAIPGLQNQLNLENARLEVLKEQSNEITKVSQAAKGAFGEGLQQEIANFLKGGQLDVEDSFLNIVKAVGEAAADEMSKSITNSVLDAFKIGPKSEAEKMRVERLALETAAAKKYAEEKRIAEEAAQAGRANLEKVAATTYGEELKSILTPVFEAGAKTLADKITEAFQDSVSLIERTKEDSLSTAAPEVPATTAATTAATSSAVDVKGIAPGPSEPPSLPQPTNSAVTEVAKNVEASISSTSITEVETCITRALSTGATTVEQAIIRAFENVTLPSIKEVESVSKPTPPPDVDATSLSVKVTGIEELEACIVRALSTGALEVERAIGRAFQNANLSIKPPALPTPNDNPLIQEVQVTAQRLPVPDKSSTTSVGMTIANGAKKIGTDIRNFGNQVQETFASDAPFLDKLGSIFSADAPWINSMTRGLAGALGGLAVGALGGSGGNSWRNAIIGGVVSGLSFGFSSWLGGLGSGTATKPTYSGDLGSLSKPAPTGLGTNRLDFAAGGIAMGGFRAFADGGIVNKPTLGLVGEGRYNEAVVPLPDGKSIPVIMQTGGGDRNNIGININVNSNGQMQGDVQATGERGVAMAQAIQNVVQLELKRQKRPGGLLSPF
jgi:hypothetical protein